MSRCGTKKLSLWHNNNAWLVAGVRSRAYAAGGQGAPAAPTAAAPGALLPTSFQVNQGAELRGVFDDVWMLGLEELDEGQQQQQEGDAGSAGQQEDQEEEGKDVVVRRYVFP